MRGGRERAQRNLYVLNLPLDATTEQFEALFARYGQVEHAVILATLDHLARRRGFILMTDPSHARAAIENLNGHEWHGYRVEVSFAIIQRSATPFPQGCARDEVSAHPRDVEHVFQPFERQSNPVQSRGQAVPQIQRDSNGSTLLLSGLDPDVVSSPAMVRALTEPFGHIDELQHVQQRENRDHGDRAVVRYCCASSASLARLSLHGLLIGAMQVQTSVSRPSHFDSLRGDKRNSDPFRDERVNDSQAGIEAQDGLSHILSQTYVTPIQPEALAGHISVDPTGERIAHNLAVRRGPWQGHDTIASAASKRTFEASLPVPRVSSPSQPASASSVNQVEAILDTEER